MDLLTVLLKRIVTVTVLSNCIVEMLILHHRSSMSSMSIHVISMHFIISRMTSDALLTEMLLLYRHSP